MKPRLTPPDVEVDLAYNVWKYQIRLVDRDGSRIFESVADTRLSAWWEGWKMQRRWVKRQRNRS